MDLIWEKFTEWLKELLVGGIMDNLTGLFDNVNAKVAEAAGHIGSTPQAWNANIYSMIRSLSDNLILPIAGVILAFVMTLELIQLIADRNNLHDIDTWVFFKWVFKTAAAVLIVSNTWNIVMGVFDAAQQDESCAGMGTTVVMAYVRPQRFTFANVGDSRLYLFNGESLKLITRDHSFVEELVRSGVITREQAETHPQRNILMRAVGTSPFIKADTGIVEWKDGDIIMLCSDGLHGSMNIRLAEEILSSESNLLTACDRLTDAALAAGSSDNVTVVLVKNAGGIGA